MNNNFSILIIEDHVPLQQTFAQIFRRGGYKTVSCIPDLNALTTLGKNPFDLVVLDLHQYSDHGLSLFFKIKKSFPLLPIILLSANSESDIIPDFEDEKAWMIIQKPFEPGFLLKSIHAITSAISKREAQPLIVAC